MENYMDSTVLGLYDKTDKISYDIDGLTYVVMETPVDDSWESINEARDLAIKYEGIYRGIKPLKPKKLFGDGILAAIVLVPERSVAEYMKDSQLMGRRIESKKKSEERSFSLQLSFVGFFAIQVVIEMFRQKTFFVSFSHFFTPTLAFGLFGYLAILGALRTFRRLFPRQY